jgi:hypothetical protein
MVLHAVADAGKSDCTGFHEKDAECKSLVELPTLLILSPPIARLSPSTASRAKLPFALFMLRRSDGLCGGKEAGSC